MFTKFERPPDPLVVTPRLRNWHAKVVAAEQAVADAERATTTAKDPASQTIAFRELKTKRRALKQAYRNPA
jgi:hypothetical protein